MAYYWVGFAAIWLSLEKKIHQKWKPNNWIFSYKTIKAESITLSALNILFIINLQNLTII
jgi:hypothetical protein